MTYDKDFYSPERIERMARACLPTGTSKKLLGEMCEYIQTELLHENTQKFGYVSPTTYMVRALIEYSRLEQEAGEQGELKQSKPRSGLSTNIMQSIAKDAALYLRYLGTKVIQATPLNLGDYNKHRGWTMPEGEDPAREGYHVIYEDGYQSWSPAEVFHAAYRPTNGLTFGLAIEALKKGMRVARIEWSEKGMWLFMQIGNTVVKDFIPRFTSLPQCAKDALIAKDEDVVFNSSITMMTATGQLQPGWVASQADILADDWMIVE